MIARKKNYFPGKELLLYQRKWAYDRSRWKFGLMSRQVGKDFSSGFEGIRDIWIAESTGRKRDWLIAAPSERQSLESLAKWKDWALSFNLVMADYQEIRDSSSEGLLKSATDHLPRRQPRHRRARTARHRPRLQRQRIIDRTILERLFTGISKR